MNRDIIATVSLSVPLTGTQHRPIEGMSREMVQDVPSGLRHEARDPRSLLIGYPQRLHQGR